MLGCLSLLEVLVTFVHTEFTPSVPYFETKADIAGEAAGGLQEQVAFGIDGNSQSIFAAHHERGHALLENVTFHVQTFSSVSQMRVFTQSNLRIDQCTAFDIATESTLCVVDMFELAKSWDITIYLNIFNRESDGI